MNTAKDEARKTLESLPEDASWDDVIYSLYVRQKIELGLAAERDGKVVSHDQVKKLFGS